MPEGEVVDAQVVDEQEPPKVPEDRQPEPPPPPPAPEPSPPAGAELVRTPTGSTELIVGATPADRVEQATAIATALDAVIKAQGMRTSMGGNRWHVNVEGWQTLATLLGLAVVPGEPTPVKDPATGVPERIEFDVHEKSYYRKEEGGGLKSERTFRVSGYSYQCRTEVFKDGALIAAATSVCSRTEKRWKEADDYAVMGMAQTRSQSRAIGAAAKWIVTLAGYQATPAEEMTPEMADASAPPAWTTALSDDGAKRTVLDQTAILVGDKIAARTLLMNVGKAHEGIPNGYAKLIGGLVATRNAVEKARSERAQQTRQQQDRAAEQPDTPSPEPQSQLSPEQEAKAERPAAGSISANDERAPQACTCKAGFASVQAHEGKPEDDCPVHGIPF